jgi:hypothetical protein
VVRQRQNDIGVGGGDATGSNSQRNSSKGTVDHVFSSKDLSPDRCREATNRAWKQSSRGVSCPDDQ